jgi:hypothetical protein
MKGPKYTMEELNQFPEKERLQRIGLMIANELHNIYSELWESRRRRFRIL